MNEKVLDAILQLLVIIAKTDGIAQEEYQVIEQFLADMLNEQDAAAYLQRFDAYAQQIPSSFDQAESLCNEINPELSARQKMMILVYLTQLVLADKILTDAEKTYMELVCKGLNIPLEIYFTIKSFMLADDPADLPLPNLYVADNKPNNYTHTEKYHFVDGLPNPIGVLRVPTINLYLLKVYGQQSSLFLNDEPLRSNFIYPLSIGGVIKGDNFTPLYYSRIQQFFRDFDPGQKISFVAENIHYTFASGDKGLEGVTVAEESGNLIAIMGASGSGKSTLLSVLSGQSEPSQGQVLLNGINIYRNKKQLKGVIGLVPQDDLLIEDLSVWQNLYYAAKLCFGNKTDAELNQLVSATLDQLGLLEIKNLKVGNPLEKTISGGQRKRLNIALELLREPAVMFLDEPTSGLSSRDSENIIDLLRGLTHQGKLIFVVIHQPSSDIFKMFDKLIILDTGGWQVFYGNPVQSVVYFKTLTNQTNKGQGACFNCGHVDTELVFNLIDNKVLDENGLPTNKRKVLPKRWASLFKDNITLPTVETNTNPPVGQLQIASWVKQLRTFSVRDLLAKLNNRQYMVINLIEGPLLAFLLAFVVRYYKTDEISGGFGYALGENINLPSYIFMSTIVALFMGLTMSAEEIIKDAKIKKREAFLSLSRSSYLLSKISVLFGFSALQMLAYVLVGNLIMGINGLNFNYWLVLFSTCAFANMLGLNISDSFKSVITIYILIPILLIPQLLLGGVVVKFTDVNPLMANKTGEVPIVGDLMTSRWSFEALAVSQFKDNAFMKDFYRDEKMIATANYKKNYYLPQLYAPLQTAENLISAKQPELYTQKIKDALALLRNEISKEVAYNKSVKFKHLDKLNINYFTPKVGHETRKYLDNLKDYYSALGNKYRNLKNKKITVLSNKLGADTLKQLLRTYNNEQLTDLVMNKNTVSRIEEHGDHLVQRIYPVFNDPKNPDGILDYRAHFYAPTKHFAGYYFDTLYFNVAVIWFMSMLLYITLYFRVLRRTVSFWGNLNLPRLQLKRKLER